MWDELNYRDRAWITVRAEAKKEFKHRKTKWAAAQAWYSWLLLSKTIPEFSLIDLKEKQAHIAYLETLRDAWYFSFRSARWVLYHI